MAEYTLSDFNQDLARKGASVGYMDSNNKIHIATETSFYINTKTNFIGFVRFVDDYYEFLFDGSFYIGFKKHHHHKDNWHKTRQRNFFRWHIKRSPIP